MRRIFDSFLDFSAAPFPCWPGDFCGVWKRIPHNPFGRPAISNGHKWQALWCHKQNGRIGSAGTSESSVAKYGRPGASSAHPGATLQFMIEIRMGQSRPGFADLAP
jgi:hypothetical protein